MTARGVARRYAAALFDVVSKRGTVDRPERDLAGFAALVAGHDELRTVLGSPAIPAQKKRALVDAMLSSAGEMSDDVRRLLLMLAERDRLPLLPEVAAAFAARVMKARRIVPAEVTTAVPLNDDRRAALQSALGKAAGVDVTMTMRVDPSIVGGFVAKVGSVVYDGSVTRQIERMRQQLLSET